jgi:ferredoxin
MNKMMLLFIAAILMLYILVAEEAVKSDEMTKEMQTLSGKLEQKDNQWFIATDKSILLELAPDGFLKEQGLKLKKNTEIEVTGFFTDELFSVKTISFKGKTYDLRDEFGEPLWSTEKPTNPHYVVDPSKCIGCRLCVNSCPVNAIEFKNGKAVIDADKCINCGICKVGNRGNYKGCPVDAIDANTAEK